MTNCRDSGLKLTSLPAINPQPLKTAVEILYMLHMTLATEQTQEHTMNKGDSKL